MDIGWNFRREHLRLNQRSHYVITSGGDQPNVVPQNASVWYFLRETDYPHIKEMREIASSMARGAALMTNTDVTSRVLGSAWPQHFNKTAAETMYANIKAVGMPTWDAADVTLAKALEKELQQPQAGLTTDIGLLVNDSLVVAVARGTGIGHLASADPDFGRIKDLKLYRPGDLG